MKRLSFIIFALSFSVALLAKDIKTNLEKKTVTIEYDADKTNVQNIIAGFEKINYKATEVKEKKK